MVWAVACCASACSAGVLCAVLCSRFMQQPAVVARKDLQGKPRATEGMPVVIVMVWAVACCASACSAGVLCAVLWARFMQQPAVVALKDLQGMPRATDGMPVVIVCPPALSIAEQVVAQFKQVANESRLTLALTHVIRKQVAHEEQLKLLDKHLGELGIELAEALIRYSPECHEIIVSLQALMRYSPECHEIIVSCRWQNGFLPNRRLFRKQFTDWGLCCVLDPERLQDKTTHRLLDPLQTTRRLDLAMTCTNSSETFCGCEVNKTMLVPVYEGEVNMEPQLLRHGLSYSMQVTFTTTLGSDGALFDVNDGCVPDKGYSRLICIAQCLEDICGCSDPLQSTKSRKRKLPLCHATQLNCLRDLDNYENSSCTCLPSCTKFITETQIESSSMDFMKYSFDPFYQGLNSSIANVVHIRVKLRQSKIFFLLPTETWLTLLSSLGGVFNMFLGVGLFSALEFIFLLVFKLPLAIKKSAEMTVPTAPDPHYR